MRLRFLALALAALSSPLFGRADTIVTYNIAGIVAVDLGAGTVSSKVGGTVTGTLAVDSSNLYASVANLTFQSNTPTATVFNPFSSDYYGPQTAVWTGTPFSVVSSGGTRPFLLPEFGFVNAEGDHLGIGLYPQVGPTLICTQRNACFYGSELSVLQTLPPLPGSTTPLPNTPAVYINEAFTSGTVTVASTPEPSGVALLGTGMLGVLAFARKRFA